MSVNTALLGTDFPKVYVQATGLPSEKYTGVVAEPAEELSLLADATLSVVKASIPHSLQPPVLVSL